MRRSLVGIGIIAVGMVAAAGGGYGDPKDRDRALVLRDLREDRISREAATAIYGLDPEA